MARYYTRHQSLKHIWYQRYNSRSSSRWDGVVPWYAKKGFKSEAWSSGTEAAWWQLMKERELLCNNENIAKAEIVEIERTSSNSIKLWVNVDNPHAEKWDFGDVNGVTIRKSDENLFRSNYGVPKIGEIIYVTLDVYHRQGNTGFSYKIKYERPQIDKRSRNKINKENGNVEDEINNFVEHNRMILEELDKLPGLSPSEQPERLNKLAKDMYQVVIRGMALKKKMKNKGLDENITDFDNTMEEITNLIESILYNFLYTTLKNAISGAILSGDLEIPKDQKEEVTSFFERVADYLKIKNGGDLPKNKEEYNYIREEVFRLEKSGKVEEFGVLLSRIENEMRYKDVEKIIDKCYKEIRKIDI